jgi:transposase
VAKFSIQDHAGLVEQREHSMPESEHEELLRLREENKSIKQLLEQVQRNLAESLEGNTELRGQLRTLQESLDVLLQQAKTNRKRQYGKKTERRNPRPAVSQPTVPEKEPVSEAEEPDGDEPGSEPEPSLAGLKHILNQDLPTEPVPHFVQPEKRCCPNCGVETKFVKYQVSYQLEKLVGSLKRLEHQQEVRSCPKCKQYVTTAEKPCPPIPGSIVGPRLLSNVIVGKLADGTPNYRQAKRFKRERATVPRSTQCDWMIAGADLLELLYQELKTELLQSEIITTDDTDVKVQDRKHPKNIRIGKMTAYRGDNNHKLNAFDYSPSKSFDRNKLFVKDYSGIIQADAAIGFDALFRDGSKTEAGCNAHSRRKFFLCSELECCEEIIDIYHDLYKIEAEIRNLPPAQKLAIRRRKSKPLVKKLRHRVDALKDTKPPKHLLMKAVRYTLKHWLALTRFLKNPEIEVDNNLTEQQIKMFVLARKNFLFFGSDRGGRAAAIHLSFISSALRNNLDPEEYLADVFARINSMKTSELKQLLPNRWSRPGRSQQPPLSTPP